MIDEPQAAVDHSGSEPQSPIFILGGFIAPAEQWARFSAEWQAALDEPPGVAYFKLTEAMSLTSKGEFSRKKGWTEQKRDNRLIELGKIIRKYVAVRIHASVNNENFVKYVRAIAVPQCRPGPDHPYLLLTCQLLIAVGVLGDRLGFTGPCKYFFDERAGFCDDLSAWWPSFKASLTRSRRPDLKRFVGSAALAYKDERRFLPLQAADFYSGYLRRYAIRSRRSTVPPPIALQQLEDIPVVGYSAGPQLAEGVRAALISSVEKTVAAKLGS